MGEQKVAVVTGGSAGIGEAMGKLNLTAEDVAEAVRWVASLPPHVNIDTLGIMPADQAER